MATKFKVGDRVRFIGNQPIKKEYNKDYFPNGGYGKILNVYENGINCYIEMDKFYPYLIQTENLDDIYYPFKSVVNINDLELVEEKCEPCYNPIKEYADRISRMLSEATDSRYGLIGELGDIEVYESKNLPIKNKTIMSKITTFAKNLVLSADEKLLRKYGLKDECGEFTDEAESLVIAKLVKENEAYLVELATAMQAEEANK